MKKTLFKVHSYLALIAVIPLMLILLTGALLVFKQEIDSLLMPNAAVVDHPGESRQNLNQLIGLVNQTFPDYELGSWEIFDDGHEADRVYLIRKGEGHWYKVYLDPYAGEVLSQPVSLNHLLTDWLLELHYTLLLNGLLSEDSHLGLVVGLIMALFLCVIGITGLILYRNFWRYFFTFQWDARPIILTRRLHRFVGIWCSPVLLVVGLTGLYFNLVEYLEEEQEHAGEVYVLEERLYNDQLDFQSLLNASRGHIEGFEPTYLLMPYEPDLNLVFFGSVPSLNPFASQYSSTVSYSPSSGEHLANYDIREAGVGWAIIDSFRALHFGNFAGLTSKIIWLVCGIGMCFMPISGVIMWWKRTSAKRRRKSQAEQRRSARSKDNEHAAA